MSPEFCLRWNNHQPNLVNVFKDLLQTGELVDVTLSAGGEFIHAHRVMLSACSLYFKELFAVNPNHHPIVILKDFHIEDLKTVVDFIYQGQVNVAQERLPHVLKAAETLRIKGLAENPRTYEDFQTNVSQDIPRLGSQSTGSSFSDSRDQGIEVSDDAGAERTTPPHKRRRTNFDTDESKRVIVKEEEPSNSNTNEENRQSEEESNQTCLVRDSTTLLQSLSPSTGEERASPSHSPTPPPSLPPTPSLTNNGDTEGGALPGLISHGQGVRNRAKLTRQPGIIQSSTDKRGVVTERRGEDSLYPEYILPASLSVTPVPCSESSTSPPMVEESDSSYGSRLQVPLLVSSSRDSSQGPLPKQLSQPELGVAESSRSVVQTFTSQKPLMSRSLGSLGSSQGYSQVSSQNVQLMPVVVNSRGSNLGSGVSLRKIQPKPQGEERYLTIKEEPMHYYQRKQVGGAGSYQQPPLIRLTPSEDSSMCAPHPSAPLRAFSEEPLAARDFLSAGSSSMLVQSVSEDTGLESASVVEAPPPPKSASFSSSSFSSYSLPPTSGHRLALRDGPALGCNFCWNSTDDHGRIQRRKTKYHCPECRTNLCIVPCYQKYHKQMERADDTDKQINKILTKTSSL